MFKTIDFFETKGSRFLIKKKAGPSIPLPFRRAEKPADFFIRPGFSKK